MESPKNIEGFRYPFFSTVRQHHSLVKKNNEAHAKQCQIVKSLTSSPSSSSSSSPPLIFQRNLEISKSLDDVWSGIDDTNVIKTNPLPTQEMASDGDITLEEFLIRAGAINPIKDQEGFVDKPMPLMMATGDDPVLISSWHEREVPVQALVQDVVGSNFKGSEDYFKDKKMHLDLKIPIQIIKEMGMGCGESFSDFLQGGGDRRKSVCSDEMMEKSIERRQRRMIKNRESAARSRARKQAYTNQLQQKLMKLRSTNSWLKKRRETEVLLNSCSTSATRYQLRRTSSASSKYMFSPIKGTTWPAS